MGGLAGFAAAVRAIAEKAETSLAVDVCRAMTVPALEALQMETPKRSGALARSEHVDAVYGSGLQATAIIAPHIRYAAFREYGGTITKHGPGSLGNPGVGWFGHSVFQHGAHYMEKGEAAGRAPASAAAARAVADFFTL
jgi:hypothetical protein